MKDEKRNVDRKELVYLLVINVERGQDKLAEYYVGQLMRGSWVGGGARSFQAIRTHRAVCRRTTLEVNLIILA
jgi:hypothetical protein